MAAAAVIEALFYAPAVVLILCPAERQSKELFRTAIAMLQKLGAAIIPDSLTTTSVDLPNGSRIIALPSTEKNVRGFSSIALLIIDEASRVPDELYLSVLPMMAIVNGRIACLSTPFGKRGFFHDAWVSKETWERIMVTAPENPRLTPAFLEDMRGKMPTAWFRQEYFCEFAETTNAVFSYEDVKNAMSADVKPLMLIPQTGLTADVKPLRLT